MVSLDDIPEQAFYMVGTIEDVFENAEKLKKDSEKVAGKGVSMFALSVVTLEKLIFDGQVRSVTAPGGDGYLELLTEPRSHNYYANAWKINICHSRRTSVLSIRISGGFLEMSHNSASVLADAVELVEEIDIKRAEDALAGRRRA